ncbi:hypothetical protein, partial [Marinagarivorans algicola]|uniref:hypothetical protein n=1 Tax=Marinagarivorans algicola TaxID=1513270 RepID=UPI001EE40313
AVSLAKVRWAYKMGFVDRLPLSVSIRRAYAPCVCDISESLHVSLIRQTQAKAQARRLISNHHKFFSHHSPSLLPNHITLRY